MVDPVSFQQWIEENFPGGGVLDAGSKSLRLQEMIADAVLEPRVTILSEAIATTGVDETQARVTLALVYAFEQRSEGNHEQAS